MATLIEQLIAKMGLRDELNVLEKTTELVRLLELRSTNVPLQINEYGKIVLCADLAAGLLEIGFDKEQALKLSGLRKSHYANNKRMFEKLLDLNKILGINDICIQLGINDVAKKATELLELYKQTVADGSNSSDIDLHPQYAAMAVYQACKLLKKKMAKTKLMGFSHLRPTQWLQLDQRWEKFMAQHYKDTMSNKLTKQNSEESHESEGKCVQVQKVGAEKRFKVETEDYERWKKRMLTIAESELKKQQEAELTEKENMILGI